MRSEGERPRGKQVKVARVVEARTIQRILARREDDGSGCGNGEQE